MKKNEAQNIVPDDDNEGSEEEEQGSEGSWPDARYGMIEAVNAAADEGAFPTILISIGPPPDGEGGYQIDVAFPPSYDREEVVELLLGAVEALTGDRH